MTGGDGAAGAALKMSARKGAFLNRVNLTGANLNHAKLTGANLARAKLTGANLNKVTRSQTICPDGTNSNNNGSTCLGHL